MTHSLIARVGVVCLAAALCVSVGYASVSNRWVLEAWASSLRRGGGAGSAAALATVGPKGFRAQSIWSGASMGQDLLNHRRALVSDDDEGYNGACTPEQEKQFLLTFKDEREYNNAGALDTWHESTSMCDDWFGILCSDDGHAKFLELRREGIDGQLPDYFTCFAQLGQINMGGNKLSGTLPASYSALTELTRIRLKNNDIEGGLPNEWSTLTNMRAIGLSRNYLSGTLPESWSEMIKLKLLYLEKMSIIGKIPDSYSLIEDLRLTLGGTPRV